MCSYPRIDVHTHILPEHLPDLASRYGYSESEWIKLQHHHPCKARMFKGNTFFREIDENCYRAEPRIKECDTLGVTVQALSTVPVMCSYWAKPEDTLDLSIILNDHIHKIVLKHPRRFIGLGTLPMQHTEFAIQELRRIMKLQTFAGIQIGSHINDMPLSDPSLFPIFEACAQLNCSVFIHPWDMAGEKLMKKYWLPWLVGMPAETSFAICSLIFGGVFERLPNLKVCFAHGGGAFPGTIGRIEHGFHCRPDLVACDNSKNPREYLKRFFIDCLVHDPVALDNCIKLFGHSQICLGSDYPFPLGEDKPGELVLSMKTLEDKQKYEILWTNGLKFLGLEEKEDWFLGKSNINIYKVQQESDFTDKKKEEEDENKEEKEMEELKQALEAEAQANIAEQNINQLQINNNNSNNSNNNINTNS